MVLVVARRGGGWWVVGCGGFRAGGCGVCTKGVVRGVCSCTQEHTGSSRGWATDARHEKVVKRGGLNDLETGGGGLHKRAHGDLQTGAGSKKVGL